MAKKITEFIAEQNTEVASVQGYIPAELRKRVLDQIKADKRAGIKTTWNTLIESVCLMYLAERKSETKEKVK